METEYISEKELTTFFERNNNRYINSTGMTIGMSQHGDIYTFLEDVYDEDEPYEVSIFTEEDSLLDFIHGFKIKSLQDIDNLNYTNSWMRYLNGAAIISYNPLELEADISFRIIKSKTIIFSLEMHFYDEAYEHLTMPEDFANYIIENESRLFTASSNRYRF